MAALVIYVRLHDGRYHGRGDWPPAPARLFQALVAGAGLAGPLDSNVSDALKWLERQRPPVIAAPRAWQPRRGVLHYMPNNDSDSIAGDPLRMARVRTATKEFRPHFFAAATQFVYAWSIGQASEDEHYARQVGALAERIYQLGRGVDMAWAWSEILDDNVLGQRLSQYRGEVYQPTEGGDGVVLPVPCQGSLASLDHRYQSYRKRFSYRETGSGLQAVFSQPAKARFQNVTYNSPPVRQLFELRDPVAEEAFASWPLERAYHLVVRLRDGAVERLKRTLDGETANIERVLVGRKPDGTIDSSPADRVRIIPLASIGHSHADRGIRRVLIEVPTGCPMSPGDIFWAFSGLDLADSASGEIFATLVRAEEEGILRHYGFGDGRASPLWRTVTPAALPESPYSYERTSARNVNSEVFRRAKLAKAVLQALRHAGVRQSVEAVRIQREPFESNGERAESFAEFSRFSTRSLWHVEIRFAHPVSGPLVIGDGRFLGLGVMAPVERPPSVHGFSVLMETNREADHEFLARNLRRAVMARVQQLISGTLPPYFSGHEPSGPPAQWPGNPHLAFAFDAQHQRLLIVAPHLFQHRAPSSEEITHLKTLDQALAALVELRAGKEGVLALSHISIDLDSDPLFAPSKVWESVTPYRVTRHLRANDAHEALIQDVSQQLRLHGFPEHSISVLHCKARPGRGLEGLLRLEFRVAVSGPILLGRTRYLGGGLFMHPSKH